MNNKNNKLEKNSAKDGQCINMAFTDDNYDFIMSESAKLNAHLTRLLNLIISSTPDEEINDFMAKNPIRKSKSLAPKRTGEHLKRIYFKLTTENYEKISACAEQNASSNTVIVNVIIEIHRKKL